MIVRDSLDGKKRYSELQRSLSVPNPYLLAARLRLLEQHGMPTRTAYPSVPPTTEYELTPLDHGLRNVIEAMIRFGGVGSQYDAGGQHSLREILQSGNPLENYRCCVCEKQEDREETGKPCMGRLPGTARLLLPCELKRTGKRYSYFFWRVIRACL